MRALLFTDIEGSTRLWELHPGPMRIAHRQQRDVIAGAVADEGGRVVKDTGDGLFAVFDDPDGALLAAVAAQRALTAIDWGEIGDLRVRIGLHVGHADVEADGDLHGRVPNRAARVMDAGHGGQILASAAFVAATSDHAAIEMVSLGRHRLKGFEESHGAVPDRRGRSARRVRSAPNARRAAEQPAGLPVAVHRS